MAYISILRLSRQEVLEAKCEPVDDVPPQGEQGILSVNSLRRSVSQVMDGKSLTGDDEAWDPNISGHDSGMVRDHMGDTQRHEHPWTFTQMQKGLINKPKHFKV